MTCMHRAVYAAVRCSSPRKPPNPRVSIDASYYILHDCTCVFLPECCSRTCFGRALTPQTPVNSVLLQQRSQSVVLLQHLSRAVYVRLSRGDSDETRLRFLDAGPCPLRRESGMDTGCRECRDYSDVVSPRADRLPLTLDLKRRGCISVTLKQTQLLIVCFGSRTEHILQGHACYGERCMWLCLVFVRLPV